MTRRSAGCGDPDGCQWDGRSGTELQEARPASPGRAAQGQRWQQPGDGTSVLAGLACSLKYQWLQKDVVFLKLFCPWNFLCGEGEERRSNFNNLIYYIICFISWCECS